MSMIRTLFFALAMAAGPVAAASGQPPPPRAKVIVVGLFHFANPGRDMFNVRMDDVLAERRQSEVERIVEGLARFAPTEVMVEWPRDRVDDRYAAYLAGTLEPSRNEVVQLGFRLAKRMSLERVHGIDADGAFPFEPVKAFAKAQGREAALDQALARVGQEVQGLNARIEKGSIGSVLRYMNAPDRVLRNHGFYIDLLRYGKDDEQPGAALASAWYARNLAICARLLQALSPGDRAVVFYGEGHAHLLRQCLVEAPGVELVEANAYLVE